MLEKTLANAKSYAICIIYDKLKQGAKQSKNSNEILFRQFWLEFENF